MSDRDPRTDHELIADIRAGDESAFDALYFRWRDWVMSLAYRFTLNHDDALDVLQETFAYLVRKGSALQLTAGSMKTFLYPVVRNLSLELRRKRSRNYSDDAAIEAVPAPSAPTSGQSDLAALLSQLSDIHREVLLMRFVDGLKIDEIADALSIPAGTVKSRLHHALETLRNDPRTQSYFLE